MDIWISAFVSGRLLILYPNATLADGDGFRGVAWRFQ
jgi:hypothetical protein